MKTEDIRKACDALDSARTYLISVQDVYNVIDLRAGQSCCTIFVAGKALSVTAFNNDRTYMPHLVRGMEMVQLGLKKYYGALVEDATDKVAAAERKVLEVTAG